VSCSYSFSSGTSPVAFGSSISEIIGCQNLPDNAEVKILGAYSIFNDPNTLAAEINEVLPVTNRSAYMGTRVNSDPSKAGVYKFKIVVTKNVGQADETQIYTSRSIEYIFLPATVPPGLSCKPRLQYAEGGNSAVFFGRDIWEGLYCSNIPSQAEVKIIGTKNGIPDKNEIVSVTTPATSQYQRDNYGDYYYASTPKNDASGKVGYYERRAVVQDKVSKAVLFVSQSWSFEFMPDLGCEISMTEVYPGFVLERANCRFLPVGATVKIFRPTETGNMLPHVVTLPYLKYSIQNEFELGVGVDPFYRYYRYIQISTDEGRTLHAYDGIAVVLKKYVAPVIPCSFTLEAEYPTVKGAAITESIDCSNMPAGGSVKLVSERTLGTTQRQEFPVSLNASMKATTRTVNTGEYPGLYKRWIKVFAPSGIQIYETPEEQRVLIDVLDE
jgi:hypothetical protein